MSNEISQDLLSVIEAGVLAPSADNNHAFEVEVLKDGGLLLFGNASFTAARYHRRILDLISLGAVAENMAMRAESLGYRTDIDWLPDNRRPSLIAHLRFRLGTRTSSPLAAAIPHRQTNRTLRYSGLPLDAATLSELTHAIADIDGVSLRFFDSGPTRKELLRLIWIAESERFRARNMHAKLFSAIRFDVGWRATAAAGLPPGALGIEAGARLAFMQLRRWQIMGPLTQVGFHRILGFRAGFLPARLAPHRGVLTTRLPLDRGAIAVGRALERTWLEAESRGLAMQPLAGSALLALPEYEDVPAGLGERLRHGWKRLTDELPLIVFRLGRASRPMIRTARPPTESFLRR